MGIDKNYIYYSRHNKQPILRKRDRKLKRISKLIGLVIGDISYLLFTFLLIAQFPRLETGIIFLTMIVYGCISASVGYWNIIVLTKPYWE